MLQQTSSHTKPKPFLVESPIGLWSVLANDSQLLSVDFLFEGLTPTNRADYKTDPETKLEQQAHCMLSRYFKGERIDFSRLPVWYPERPPLFAKVMRILQTMPYGEVQSYQWLAEKTGNILACRAVGGALGQNPIPIIIPCHRIVAKSQRLGGFMRSHPRGTDLKRFLLELEGHRFQGQALLPAIQETIVCGETRTPAPV